MFWPFTVWGFLKPNFEPHKYWISRTRCCNSTYRLRYWNTNFSSFPFGRRSSLQQYLPFTVLKLLLLLKHSLLLLLVATVLTVYGIETKIFNIPCIKYFVFSCNSTYRLRYWNKCFSFKLESIIPVATVLTVYGIETR